ncbi:hypothetical protein H8923_01265 [Romboutsia hominis]|uniref:Uncharacterized protein n=1 Tax=Romboutsia faecis TaxID=2764597 RepID=A0ABR7JKN7_9FIRM|nr:hypothetical protein [Romboutsia faecis]MBC5995375.1 hypothetical protein [Romboutsia faecis]
MSISAIINIAKEYLLLGIIVVVLASIIFSIGYLVVYRRLLKGTKD